MRQTIKMELLLLHTHCITPKVTLMLVPINMSQCYTKAIHKINEKTTALKLKLKTQGNSHLASNKAGFEGSWTHAFAVIHKININLNSLLKPRIITSSSNVFVLVYLHMISPSIIRTRRQNLERIADNLATWNSTAR